MGGGNRRRGENFHGPHEYGQVRILLAEDNSVYSVYANQCGYNGHSTHSGGAHVIGPDQSVLARSEPTAGAQMVTAELDAGLLGQRRRKNPSLRFRRPEVYGELTRMI